MTPVFVLAHSMPADWDERPCGILPFERAYAGMPAEGADTCTSSSTRWRWPPGCRPWLGAEAAVASLRRMMWPDGESLRHLEMRVRPDFRRTVVFGMAALAALVAGHEVGGVHAGTPRMRLIAYGCAVLVAVCGFVASRTAAREVQRIAVARAGDVAGTPLRLVVLLAGYVTVAISVCDLVGLELRQLLVGGAITGIILGLAAQPVLSNLFAGLVLLFARPYVPGQRIRVMSGALNGPHVGVIVSAGLLYTVLDTDAGPLNIPNSSLLSSAVGPAPADSASAPGAADDSAGQDDDASAAVVLAAAEAGEAEAHKHPGPGSS